MKKGPLIHGVLLVVALLVAYQTWTREETKDKPKLGDVEVWDRSGSKLTEIQYQAAKKSVRVAWRQADSASFLWGEVSRTREIKGKKPAAPTSSEDKAGAKEPPEVETETTKRQFPVGDEGDKVVENFTKLLARRDLGKPGEEDMTKFGLDESKDTLSVHFGTEQETLQVGKRVYGGSDRYVLHKESGKVYVLASKVMRPVEAGESTLRLKKMHAYEPGDVEQVSLDTGKDKKKLVRLRVKDAKGERKEWAYSETPDKVDQGLENFLDRAKKLTPVEYEDKVEGVQKVLDLRFSDKSGKELGYTEFWRHVPAELAGGAKDQTEGPADGEDAEAGKSEKPPEISYYIRTERTRSLGKVSRLAAERFDQDAAELFGYPAPPTTPAPKRKAIPPIPHTGKDAKHGGTPPVPGKVGKAAAAAKSAVKKLPAKPSKKGLAPSKKPAPSPKKPKAVKK